METGGSTTFQGARLASVALTVGACGLPLAAQATVVSYTTAQAFSTAVVGFNTSTFAIDPNQTSQFTFSGTNIQGSFPGNFASVTSSTSNTAVKYNSGDTIGPNAFNGGTGTAGSPSSVNYPKNPYFIGLEIQQPVLSAPVLGGGTPSTFYGYAEIGLTNTGGGNVIEYAFQTDGTPISAGAISSVPEPGSLALLALGAAGVGAFRRRKPAR